MMLWTYEYTISTSHKDISHFILELTEGTTQNDFMTLLINGNPVTFGSEVEVPGYLGQHPGNPDYPTSADIYGIKFDVGGNPVTYSFTTEMDPVWGNFYAKGGKIKIDKNKLDIVAYNNALGIAGFNSDDRLDFIARPNGRDPPPVAPEPLSSLLFIAGGAVLAGRGLHKKKKQSIAIKYR